MTTIGIIGENKTRTALSAALADTAADSTPIDIEGIPSVDMSVIIGEVGSADIAEASNVASANDRVIITIELGGIGGKPVENVDAAIAGLSPEGPCWECLSQRIAAVEPAVDDGAYSTPIARFAGAVAGFELSSLLTRGQSTLLGGVIEVPYQPRQILPVPSCNCGNSPSMELSWTDTERSLSEAIGAAEIAFDERMGPITAVGEAESFPVPYYLASLADAPFSDADIPDFAAGVAADWDPAFMKALGEALERYCAAVYREQDFITDPAKPIDPSKVVGPDGWTKAVTKWYPATNLSNGSDVVIPAELVVFPPPERTIRPAITTGLGLGNNGIEALLAGLYEVIERDATMISWYSTYEPLEVSVTNDEFQTLRRRAKSEDLELTALLVTQDIDVPVISVFAYRNTEWPKFAAGSAASLDPNAAATSAAAEALQNWVELRRMGKEEAQTQSGAIGKYASFPEPVQTILDTPTEIPIEAVGPDSPPAGENELTAVIERVQSVELHAFASRITTRDVESLGFEAVRVVIPEAQPLFTGDSYFGKRAQAVPGSLGFKPTLEGPFHPYP